MGFARFFLVPNPKNQVLKPTPEEIETRLETIDPTIEFLALEQAGGDLLRLVIDRDDGVTLDLCQQVTSGLGDLLTEYSLEVSSPGPERPLTKPAHFERFTGRRARVTVGEPVGDRRNFTGRIAASDPANVILEVDGNNFEIPFANIERSHLVPEIPQGAAK